MIRLKTKEDIALLREGGARHAAIMRELAAMVKPGLRADELEAKAEALIAAGGDQSAFKGYRPEGAERPFPASLCVSVNEEVVHGIPNESDKTLKEGDIVTLDLGLVHKGMITDMAVTVPVGKIAPELAALLDCTRRALNAGIKAARGGKRVGDVSAAIERVGVAGGFGIVEELAGHGVGYHVHEDPFVPNYGEPGKGPVLKPGLVIAIEPIFNLGERFVELGPDGYTYVATDGKPSAHFEHTVLITKGGAEVLTA
ncbi:MAG: type I methionyl aminopeptidase [Patescibacteria group bacterium]|nr:type I methionyl aminopeptidase [Patescibacteria group bacterium]